MKNMHIPIPDHVHAVLMQHAKASGESATGLAREAIEKLARQLEHDRINAEMRAFAEEFAGTELDLDPAWEAAGLEVWRQDVREKAE